MAKNSLRYGFIILTSKEWFAKNLGQKIIQIKVNLGDHTYVAPGITVDRYNCFDSYLEY